MAEGRKPPAARRRAPGRAARLDRADPHTLVGAYVMDAVSDGDRARFDQHLASCETCRAEVRGLREATARLAAAAAIRPRAGLREQTMLAAGQLRQLPPATRDSPAGQVTRWRAARHALVRLTGAGRPRAWVPRLAVAVAAASVAAAVVMGSAMHGADNRLSLAQGRSHAIAAVLGAPDVTMMTAEVRSGGSATVVMSHRDRALVFTAADLPALPGPKSYELWLMGPGGPRPAGMLPAARRGMSGPMVVSGLARGDKVSLTVEPASGSARPTSPPILMLGLGT
jgi:Anti-sigma-K factor rskA/Putative zinc-finger